MKAAKYIVGIIVLLIIGFGLGWSFFATKDAQEDVKRNDLLYGQNKDSAMVHESNTEEVNQDVGLGDLNGIYEYEYEYNTETLVENHYIHFEKNKITYYGTSDDFDLEREGYRPGFFAKEILDFKSTENSFSFTLKVNNDDFFEKAITPYSMPDQNPEWTIGVASFERSYEGKISKNELIVETDGYGKRVFVKK